jgi:hypothetical protein
MATNEVRSFRISQGQVFSQGITVYSETGTEVDITGAVIELTSQYNGTSVTNDGTDGAWMRAALNAGNTGIDFLVDATLSEALEVGIYTHFCTITYGSGTVLKVAEFQIDVNKVDDIDMPISKTNILLRVGLKFSDINENELLLAIKDGIAMTQSIIPSDVYAYCSEYGYPGHIVTLAERYATAIFRTMVWPATAEATLEEREGIEGLLRNVTVDTDGDKIEDKGGAGTIDIFMS